MMADPTPDDGIGQDSTGADGSGCSLHEPYALQVLGDQMEPEFPDGCIVIIEPTDARRDGSYVFAEVEGVRWFRRYVKDTQGGEHLIAENPRYPAIELTGLEWSVLGVIIQRNIRRRTKHYAARGPEAAAVGVKDLTRH